MKILKSIKENGNIIGYQVEDSDFVLSICKKALYLDMYIEPLTQAGYKYYSYEADDIEDPEGTPISTYESIDRSEIEDIEWFASIDLAESSALSDTEASKYYTFRQESAVEFKREDSYEINTREEFIQYLEELRYSLYSVSYSTDNRPINSFVNPDALFTIEEVSKDSRIHEYFELIIKRHHMRSYKDYEILVEWLQNKGVLNNPNPSTAEFLNAYYAWGPEGIKDMCSKYELKLSVDGIFNFMKDPLASDGSMSYILANRESKVVVIDGSERLHFLKTHEDTQDISDVRDFNRSRIIINSNDDLLSIRRMTNTGKKYTAIGRSSVSDVSDRLYFTIIAENGYTYTYKVAHNRVKIGLAFASTNQEIFGTTHNFCFCSLLQTVNIPFDAVSNQEDYKLWNMAILKASMLIKAKTKKAPAKSTSEFMLKDGVNPLATIDVIANSIVHNQNYISNRRYPLNEKGGTLKDALEIYLADIPDYILKAYKLEPEDLIDGMNSFIELADQDDLLDRREAMLQGKINRGEEGFDDTYLEYCVKVEKKSMDVIESMILMGNMKRTIDAVDYYTKVKFISDCLHGGVSIDRFGDGILEDAGASYKTVAECILSVVYAEYGDTPNPQLAEDFVLNCENSDLIDISRIIKLRDMSLKGYLIDFAIMREARACEINWIWAYCTRMFREISNAPIEKQRPYLMEIVTLESNKVDGPTRKLMTQLVVNAIEEVGFDDTPFDELIYDDWSMKKVMLKSADYVAARLFFYVLAGGVKDEPIDGNYKVTINLVDDTDLVINIPVNVYQFIKAYNVDAHRHYITVYDWCKYEHISNHARSPFHMCLVNADIDPWHVRPKKGYKIKSYSLLPHYYEAAALNKVNGDGWYEEKVKNKEIVTEPFSRIYSDRFYPESDVDEMYVTNNIVKNAQSYDELLTYLEYSQFEFIFAYVKRWALCRKEANALGKKLYSIPLKQDITFGAFASMFNEEIPPQEMVMVDDQSFNDKMAQQITDTAVVSWKDFHNSSLVVESKAASIDQFKCSDFDMSYIDSIMNVVDGSYRCEIPVVITGNYINVKDDSLFRVAVSRLTDEQIMGFVQSGVLNPIGDNKYFIRAINGDFVITVK